MRYTISHVALSLLAPLALASPFAPRNETWPIVYDFLDITPTVGLRWTSCYDNFTCARLEVPLDYTNPSLGTTAIAYIRKPATSKSVDEAESILFNPGGPGDSGVAAILDQGDLLASYVGPDYNLIGFDPRGVNNSGPSKSNDSKADSFELTGGFGDWCSRVHANDSAKYANTPAVARDMLNFAERNAEARGQSVADAKVWYWGISYGTILGSTFSALFPDRVGRVILDSVVDGENYYDGKWTTGLLDADKAAESFGDYCHAAGPEHCAFYFDNPEKIMSQIKATLENLRTLPAIVTDPNVTDSPRLVTYEDLASLIFSSLYTPYEFFPYLAQVLHDLQSRNGSSLFQAIQIASPTALYYGGLILCQDAAGRYNLSTPEKWEHHIDIIRQTSQWGVDAFASVPLLCRQMNIVPPNSQQFHGYPSANRTNFPILFIGNKIDPVAPVRG
ncbi:hypothetical protein BDV96DRAFT_614719 [Lophiotrema nucula]|uniref:AB hydrolase-1 domain-containing protein n=1 Tax=Lophiotrema nucula TaxID=690887 RepID=A0A6A5YXQ3_9PLEO|nr:hypothetical protein BDV96DRAFT_614719 [Lophiotrema nucula]